MKNQKTMKNNSQLVKSNNQRIPTASGNLSLNKIIDKNGVSFQESNATYPAVKHLKKDVKVSKYGIKPYVCYPDTEFNEKADVVKVVNKFNNYKAEFHNSRKALNREANRISNEANIQYKNEIMRSKLLTEKNILSARVDSLRLTNKALFIEKEYNEKVVENNRHKQVLSDISKLKILLLENNDINLKEKIVQINLNRELELDNAKSNYDKVSTKINEQKQINELKNKWVKERVKILSTGREAAKKKLPLNEKIEFVRERNQFVSKDDAELENLYYALKKMDINKISNKRDRDLAMKIIEKFETDNNINKLINNYISTNDEKHNNNSKVNKVRNRIFSLINKKYHAEIDVDLQRKILLNAKKETLFISMPVSKFLATQNRTLHAEFSTNPKMETKKKPTAKKKSAAKKKSVSKKSNVQNTALVPGSKSGYTHYEYEKGFTSIDQKYSDAKINDVIRKWKKIENKVESHDEFCVKQHNNDSYKINYSDRVEETNKKSFLDSLLNIKFSSNKVGEQKVIYYSNIKLLALKRRLENLSNDPIIFNNRNGNEYKNLQRVILSFSQLDLKKLPKSSSNDNFIIEVKQILDFYDSLAIADEKYRHYVQKSTILDAKLMNNINRQENQISSSVAKGELKYQRNVDNIKEHAKTSFDEANQKHLIKKQEITENISWQGIVEEDLHEKNKAFISKTTIDLQKRSFIYENNQLDALTSEINSFNKKHSDDMSIDMSSIPTKIECFETIKDNKIEFVKQGNSVFALSKNFSKFNTKTYVGKTLNTQIPEDVTKIVVLDKFKNIHNPLVRANALKELAEVNYDKAVKYNLARETAEIDYSTKKLMKAKKVSDDLVDDAYEMNQYLELLDSKSKYSNFVQKESDKKSKIDWSITESNLRRQNYIENHEFKDLENKNKKLELSQKRIEQKRNSYLTSIENDLVLEQIRRTSESKKPSTKYDEFNSSLVPYSKNQKYNSSNNTKFSTFSKKILNLFSSKKEPNIDEVIGKK